MTDTDYYAVGNTVCVGRYPGTVVSEHESHWDAVEEMLRLNKEYHSIFRDD